MPKHKFSFLQLPSRVRILHGLLVVFSLLIPTVSAPAVKINKPLFASLFSLRHAVAQSPMISRFSGSKLWSSFKIKLQSSFLAQGLSASTRFLSDNKYDLAAFGGLFCGMFVLMSWLDEKNHSSTPLPVPQGAGQASGTASSTQLQKATSSSVKPSEQSTSRSSFVIDKSSAPTDVLKRKFLEGLELGDDNSLCRINFLTQYDQFRKRFLEIEKEYSLVEELLKKENSAAELRNIDERIRQLKILHTMLELLKPGPEAQVCKVHAKAPTVVQGDSRQKAYKFFKLSGIFNQAMNTHICTDMHNLLRELRYQPAVYTTEALDTLCYGLQSRYIGPFLLEVDALLAEKILLGMTPDLEALRGKFQQQGMRLSINESIDALKVVKDTIVVCEAA